jgi:hypothetical protein
MEERNVKYSDIIRNIDDIFDYFKFHSKNLTKTQEYKLNDLQDLIHELRIAPAFIGSWSIKK